MSKNVVTLKSESEVTEGDTICQIYYGFLLVFYSNFVPKTATFWDIRLVTTATLKPGLGSLKVIRTDTYRSAT